ncbi:MAG: hypothetical protein GC149_14245 [Gammaproteobacteria bacterium]|nr:hypothetical protein [Gammaproteobacteria bacterium]
MSKRYIARFRKLIGRGLLAMLLLTGITLMWDVVSVPGHNDTQARLAANTPHGGWGSEALEAIHANVAPYSPIRLANACGLGASSCFKCHNGSRAKTPASDPKTAPWHVQHEKVNYSCAGCHAGNPRLMKKELAHTRLIADPRTQPAQTCFTCHEGSNKEDLLKTYQAIAKGGN